MEPAIYRGDLLVVEGKNPEDIRSGTIEDKQGDIIIYDAHGLWETYNDEPVVHRVVNKTLNPTDNMYYFIVKGDHNPNVDPAIIPEDHILGVVKYIIPKIGYVKIQTVS